MLLAQRRPHAVGYSQACGMLSMTMTMEAIRRVATRKDALTVAARKLLLLQVAMDAKAAEHQQQRGSRPRDHGPIGT